MSNTVNISNPHSQYGSLSNNFNGKELRLGKPIFDWKNVTKSIYGRMLGRYDSLINKAKDSDVINLYERYKNDEDKNIIVESVRASIEAKFKEDTELTELLISTGNSPIFYKSNNTFLGLGLDNQGMNNYGVNLEQIRLYLINKQKEEKIRVKDENKQEAIFDTYLAYKTLETIILSGNNISQYMNKSAKEIVNMIGRENIESVNPSKRVILQLANKGGLEECVKLSKNQNNLVLEITKKNLQQLRHQKRKERNEIVFDMYADYLIEKFYENIDQADYQKAKEQEFGGLNWKQKNDLEENLYSQYIDGLLSARLSDSIDKRLSSLIIPTQDQVDEALKIEITYSDMYEQEKDEMFKTTSGEPVYIYPSLNENVPEKYRKFVSLSPLSFTKMFNVNNYIFPTISMYIIFRLIDNVLNEKNSGFYMGNTENIYTYFLKTKHFPKKLDDFIPYEQANKLYIDISTQSYKYYTQKYAREAIDLKLLDRSIQDVLLITGNKELVYNDENIYLGLSENIRGENYVGKYLMFIRDILFKQRKGETLKTLTTQDISNIISSNDVFMNAWFKMRIKDMCKNIILIKNFMYKQFTQVSTLTPEFINNCLDSIYFPCSHIYIQSKEISIPVDSYFKAIVMNDCRGFKEADDKVISVLWNKFVVMIYYLINTQKDLTSLSIKSIIAAVTDNLSQKQECVFIVEDQLDNCILSAIINLLKNIHKFFQNNTDLQPEQKILKPNDVNLAASIILNKDLVEKSTKTKTKEKEDKSIQPPSKPLDSVYAEMLADHELEQLKSEKPKQLSGFKKPTKFNKKPIKFTKKIKQTQDLPLIEKDELSKELDIEFAKILKEDEEIIEIDEDEIIEDTDGIEVSDKIYDDEDEDEGENSGYDDESEDNESEYDESEDDEGDGYSPKYTDFIKVKIHEYFKNIEDVDEIVTRILEMLEIIKNNSLPKKIKLNRINFFASI
jgi:predicted NAD-dependent protein-ADP-ribosyltransferase YbiA (DUF1768 family)